MEASLSVQDSGRVYWGRFFPEDVPGIRRAENSRVGTTAGKKSNSLGREWKRCIQ